MMSLMQVSQAVEGSIKTGSMPDVLMHDVAINTRADCDGRLFVALKGENFDAHDFVAQAEANGAAALMVEREVQSQLPTVEVASTHKALTALAAWWRQQFAVPVLAITGSVGKTTVKEMLGSIMAELGQGVVTNGNLNNEIGVPLTLMRLATHDRYAVVEMGMNHAGEIERLSQLACPTVATVNNAAAAHLEGLGTIEAVAHAKGEIFSGLASDGVAVINQDDPYAELWKELAADRKVITFGLNTEADVTATYKQKTGYLKLAVVAKGKKTKVHLNSVGEHNVVNALSAIATALAANVPLPTIARGLENYVPVKGRLNSIQLSNCVLFDDTYNANPASMQAAIRVLSGYENNTLIVGDMAELGDSCEQEHQALGEFALKHGIDKVLACGEFAELVAAGFGEHGEAFESQSALLSRLEQHPISAAAVLVKGSRSAKMEVVVEALKANDKKHNEQQASEPNVAQEGK